MACSTLKPDRELRKALAATGLPYEVISTRKHLKYYLNGKMIFVSSRSRKAGGDTGIANLLACIKREAKRIIEGTPVSG